MTGAYLRIYRNDRWENIEVEHLTDEERHSLFDSREKDEILRWFNLVCKTLSEMENNLEDKIS